MFCVNIVLCVAVWIAGADTKDRFRDPEKGRESHRVRERKSHRVSERENKRERKSERESELPPVKWVNGSLLESLTSCWRSVAVQWIISKRRWKRGGGNVGGSQDPGYQSVRFHGLGSSSPLKAY